MRSVKPKPSTGSVKEAPFSEVACDIRPVAKRRDGGTRYWCINHKADATEKYGKPAKTCLHAHMERNAAEPFRLDADLYQGGIALWGAVPAVYDTTRLPSDNGIHVHARQSAKDKKEIDGTFPAVRVVGKLLPKAGIEISAIDAIYYMVSSIFGFQMTQIVCTHCGEPHLDRDWFSVHPHSRHLCSSCGRIFTDSNRRVGNPICGVRAAFGMKPHQTRSANRSKSIRQADFPGGIQIWGSNAALIWTADAPEEEGIHVHAFLKEGDREPEAAVDQTFSEVTIDGVGLDPTMVRVLMAQNTLPHLQGRVTSIECRSCGASIFSRGELSFTPVREHICDVCGTLTKSSGGLQKKISNPLTGTLAGLARTAPRPPQAATLHLLPETL